MRHGLLALAAASGIAAAVGVYAYANHAALSDSAELAIELRCESQSGAPARECRKLLRRLYLAGSLDPETTLRSYCDAFRAARWRGRRPRPPAMCAERYGGWKEG